MRFRLFDRSHVWPDIRKKRAKQLLTIVDLISGWFSRDEKSVLLRNEKDKAAMCEAVKVKLII